MAVKKCKQTKKNIEAKNQKRVCKAPYKKWTETETQSLILFLKENRPMEKPTAQAYYRRYLQQNGIESEWKHVRCKVRHMQKAYNGAKALGNSTGVGAMIEGETMQSAILKKCPMFYDYEDVFGYRENALHIAIVDTESEEFLGTNAQQTPHFVEVDVDCEPYFGDETFASIESNSAVEEDMIIIDPSEQSASPDSESVKKSLKRGQKGIYSRTGLADVLQAQSEILSMRKETKAIELKLKESELELQKEKFLFDKENQAKEYDMQKERLAFEKEKHDIETKRMDKQLQMERKLRIMEMNMKKEVALKEIELKERVEMEKLKKKVRD